MIEHRARPSSCSIARNAGAASVPAFSVQGTQPGEAAFCRQGFALPDPQGGPVPRYEAISGAGRCKFSRLSRMFEGATPPLPLSKIVVYRGWKSRLSRMFVYADTTPGSPENKGFQHHRHFMKPFDRLPGRVCADRLSRMKSRLSRMFEGLIHRLPSIADVRSSIADVFRRLSRMPVSVYRGCKSAAKPRVSGLPGSLTRVRG